MLKKDSLQKTLQNLVPGYTIELVTVTLSLAVSYGFEMILDHWIVIVHVKYLSGHLHIYKWREMPLGINKFTDKARVAMRSAFFVCLSLKICQQNSVN